MKKIYKILIFVIFIISLTTITLASNIQNDKTTKDSEKIPTETYLISGNKVDVLNCSKDDGILIISGSSINLTGTYNDDVFVFGNNIYINGTFNSNLYVVSSTSSNIESTVKGSLFNFSTSSKISSTVEKDLMTLTSQLNTSDTTLIKRDLFAVSMSQTELGGTVARNANVIANFINYSGKILGNSFTQANDITYTNNAVFEGTVTNRGVNKPDFSTGTFKSDPVFIQQNKPNFLYSIARGTFLTYTTSLIIMLLCKLLFPDFLNKAKQNIKANFAKITILPLPTVVFFVVLSLVSIMFNLTLLAVAVMLIGVTVFIVAPYIALITISEYISSKRSSYILLFLLSLLYSLLTQINFISIYVTLVIYLIGIGIIAYNILDNISKSRKSNKTI